MKAIYINLDPYLAAFAAWINGGKVGTAPSFDPLPLAVTIPLGESAAIAIPYNDGNETNPVLVNVDGEPVTFDIIPSYSGDAIATGVRLRLSAYDSASYPALYNIYPVSGNSASVQIPLAAEDGSTITIPFTVLVRRETAQGPVDLVDFTPPLTAAAVNTALGGTGAATNAPLKGVSLSNATNAPAPSAADIKSALVAAGDGALAGVSLGGAIIRATGPDDRKSTMFIKAAGEPGEEVTYPILAGEDVIIPLGGNGVS